MKQNPPLHQFTALGGLACLLAAGPIAAQELEGRLAARPLTPQEIRDYALPASTQTSGGLFTVGVGQPVYLEAQVLIETSVSGIAWDLSAKPSGSTSELAASPLPIDMPIYNPGDRVVNKVVDRMLLVPDRTGVFKVTAIVTTATGELVFEEEITSANYVGVGTIAGASPLFPQCALCHEDKATGWSGTAHATALAEKLDDSSGHFGPNCIKCHSVGYDSAPAAVNGGFDDVAALAGWSFPETLAPGNWDAVPAALKTVSNVQCENCHGPGSEHFGQFNRTSVSTSSGDCAQCHDSAPYHVITQQWNESRHAIADRYPSGEGRQSCVPCHTALGFIDTTDGVPSSQVRTEYEAIVCSACHDPHEGANPHQIRKVGPVVLGNGHEVTDGGNGQLCMNCHKSRQNAKPYVENTAGSSRFGPHYGPQSDMLAGTNAYEYDRPMRSSTHNFAVEGTCVTCHLQTTSASDPAHLKAGGHTFNVSWDGGTAEDYSDDSHLVGACVDCHGEIESFDIVRQDYDGNGVLEGVQTEVRGLLNQLALALPPIGTPEVAITSAYTKPQLAAAFNYLFVLNDGSYGIHNTAYAVSLLQASIADLNGGAIPGDADNDCLPDEWEIAHFGSITLYTATDDPDGDKVTNAMEYAARTLPMVADSDNDGYSDFDELHVGTDPNDAGDSPEVGRTSIFHAAEMVFSTEEGKTYQIQAVGGLSNSTWENHGEPFDGTGQMMQLFISTRDTEKSFYRVVELP